MSKQYYLITSLPELSLGGENYHTEESFLGECEKWLNGSEMEALLSAKRGNVNVSGSDLPSVREWKRFDGKMRSQLVEARKARKEGERVSRGLDLAESVMESGDPLEAELALERARWEMLSGMELEYFFDVNRLAIYYIKLQTAIRIAGFDKDKGESFFHDQCEVRYDGTEGHDKGH